MPKASPELPRWAALLLVAGAAFLAYANNLGNGFVWDDHVVIEANPLLKDASNLQRILAPSFHAEVRQVSAGARPMFVASLLADRAVWHGEAMGFHLTSNLLHAGNSLLAWRLGAALLGSPPAALLGGLLFALHPIHTEAVDQVSFRADLLATLFVLLGFWAYLRLRETRGRGRALWLAGLGGFYGLGLLSKEMAVTLPLLALLYEWYYRPRELSGTWRLPLMTAGLCVLVAAGYFSFRAPRSGYHAISGGQSVPAAASAARKFDPSQPQWSALYSDRKLNLFTMSGVFADYFRLLVAPHPLRADRAPALLQSWRDWRLWASWLWLAFLLGLAWWWRGRGPWTAAGFGLAWCFVSLLPVSNLVRLYNPCAERYLYLVSVGACWSLAVILVEAGRRLPARAAAMPALLVLAAWGGLTWSRNRDWRSDEALFSREAQLKTGNARVYYNLGVLRQQEGRLKEAAAEYLKSAAINPGYSEALANLAKIYEQWGQPEKALDYYRRSLAANPQSPVYAAMGALLDRAGRSQEAMTVLREALRREPGYVPARLNLAWVLARAGRRG